MRIENGIIHVDSLEELVTVIEDISSIEKEDYDENTGLGIYGNGEDEPDEDVGYESGPAVDYEEKFRNLNEQHTEAVDRLTDLEQRCEILFNDYLSANEEARQTAQEVQVLTRLYQRALGEIAGLKQQLAIMKLRNSLSDGVDTAQGQVLQSIPGYLS